MFQRVGHFERVPTPVLLPGKSHGWRSLVGCSPWGCEESDTTERLHFHFSLSCIGEGNGNPLQCSCLENPRVRGAWWAAVSGVAQSRLKRRSSSSIEIYLSPYATQIASGKLLCNTGSSAQRSVTPWTIAHHAPLSMGFPGQEYWSGLPCPPPGALPDPG